MGVEGSSGLLEAFLTVILEVITCTLVCTVNTSVQLFFKVLWRVVSAGVDLLSLFSQMNTSTAIFLDLLFTTNLSSCLLLDPFTAIFSDSACVFLVVIMLVLDVVVFSFCFYTSSFSDLWTTTLTLFSMRLVAVWAVLSACCCYTANSSVSALTLGTFTVIFLDWRGCS